MIQRLPVREDVEVDYIPEFLTSTEADELYDWCMENLPFGDHKVRVYGKMFQQPRKTCVIGPSTYTYSGLTLEGVPMPKVLRRIAKKIAKYYPDTESVPNTVLANYYKDGTQYIGTHYDKETDLVPNSCIASLSLGATRRFDLIDKETKEKVQIPLNSGDLLIMGNNCQKYYLHTVPKQLRVKEGRINLTFRTVRN